jgi:uncharacterized membrane protein YtjA (UPF0391 family)
MLRASLAFFVFSLVAFIFGAYGLAGFTMEIGKTLLIVSVALTIIYIIYSFISGKKVKGL